MPSLSDSAIRAPDGVGPGYVEGNRHYGTSAVTGSVLGHSPGEEFLHASTAPGLVDLHPLDDSTLRDSGSSSHGPPDDDFNSVPRPANEYWDVGAYEWVGGGNPGWQIQAGFKDTSTGVDGTETADEGRSSLRVHPNPSGHATTINFSVPCEGPASLRVYDVTGRLVDEVLGGSVSAGPRSVVWTPNVASGIYFCILSTGDPASCATAKVVVLR
ncbi:MAG: T9SS type A sorting domain-containing protein [Planctomycetota bacterium]